MEPLPHGESVDQGNTNPRLLPMSMLETAEIGRPPPNGVTREEQDAYALQSQQRTPQRQAAGQVRPMRSCPDHR